MDRFSKVCRLVPLKGLPTAWETAMALFTYVFRYYRLPEDIVSDRGSQFTSRVWSSFFRLLNIGMSLSSEYHPQSNGQTERLNQEIGRFLRSYCSQQQDWCQFSGLGRVCPKLSSECFHGTYTLSMRPGISAPVVPMDRGDCQSAFG